MQPNQNVLGETKEWQQKMKTKTNKLYRGFLKTNIKHKLDRYIIYLSLNKFNIF